MMESSEGVRPAAGVAMEFPVSDEKAAETTSFSSATATATAAATRVPRRLRKRLLAECSKSPCTVEEIEAKLRHADLRRQVFIFNFTFMFFRKNYLFILEEFNFFPKRNFEGFNC